MEHSKADIAVATTFDIPVDLVALFRAQLKGDEQAM